jgi:hypothetical protein
LLIPKDSWTESEQEELKSMKRPLLRKAAIAAAIGLLVMTAFTVSIILASPAQDPFTTLERKLDQILSVLAFNDLRVVTQNWDKNLDSRNGGPNGCNSTRFSCIFGGQAVHDNETGIVWELAPSGGPTTWAVARVLCLNKTVGGKKGWRLASVHEMASLLDGSQSVPTLPAGHPFNANFVSGPQL